MKKRAKDEKMNKLKFQYILLFVFVISMTSCQKKFWHTKPAVNSQGDVIKATSVYHNGSSQKVEMIFREANSKVENISVIESPKKFSDFEIHNFGMGSCTILFFDKKGNKIHSVKWTCKKSETDRSGKSEIDNL